MAASTLPRSERRGAGSRAALLRAARRLFAERGFHGTSVGEIADEAGLRKPSLFHHFATKEALYTAVMAGIFAELGAVVAENASRGGSFVDRLDAMNDTFTAFFAAEPSAARLLFREALEHGPVLAGEGVNLALEVLRSGERFLQQGMGAGEFAHQDARQLVMSLLGIHLTYFAISPLVEPFLEISDIAADGGEARRVAVRAQARALVLAPAAVTAKAARGR